MSFLIELFIFQCNLCVCARSLCPRWKYDRTNQKRLRKNTKRKPNKLHISENGRIFLMVLLLLDGLDLMFESNLPLRMQSSIKGNNFWLLNMNSKKKKSHTSHFATHISTKGGCIAALPSSFGTKVEK